MKLEQITAWALDETSAEERQQLEAELHEDPTAQKTAEDTKAFCDFLLAELRDDSLALTDAQRERLKLAAATPEAEAAATAPALPQTWAAGKRDERAQTVERKKQTRWTTGVGIRLAAAACLTLGCVWVWQEYGLRVAKGESLASIVTGETDEQRYRIQSPSSGSASMAMAPSPPGMSMPDMSMPGTPGLPGLPMPGYGVPGLPPVPGAPPSVLSGNTTMTSGDVAELQRMQDRAAYGLTDANANASSLMAVAPVAGNMYVGGTSQVAMGGISKSGAGTLQLDGQSGRSDGVLAVNGGAVAATPPPNNITADQGFATYASTPPTILNPTSRSEDTRYFEAETTGTAQKNQFKANWQTLRESRSETETYQRIVENELKDVAREPLSTFSIDVDTAAYANVRRFLNQGAIPPADAVRIEELINYFPAAEEGPAPGAKEPFGVRVEFAPCPWQPQHRLARIAVKGRELGAERKASNLVFLVDVSGSMGEPAKLPLVQQSLRMLTEQLGEGDRVTMVVYAGSSGLVLPPTNGEDKQAILAAIDRLQAGGGTHGSAGIQLAYEQAAASFIKDGVNRVILCTDGDFNVGVSSPEELEKLITRKAKGGVFLSVLGFGSGNLKDRTMETLADKGNGNYAYIDSLSEARKVLVEQMSGTLVTIAKDVKIQVEFNPAAVRSYRLVGYENRLMAKEDFNDDTKDAGEIGAGHSVVALYEVVPANLPPGAELRPLVDNLRYQTPATSPIPPAQLAEAAKSGEVMTVKLRYKEPDSSLSKLIEVPAKDKGRTLTASTEEFKFSAAVAGFGLLLRDSAYKGTLGWETVRKLALDGKGSDKLGYRGEFLQLIDKARGLKETRP
ncbi:MAG TPA: von Willebrand factor type A domain-containing protein [Prosthecobacter sp.]